MTSHQRGIFATQAFVTPAGAQFLSSKSAIHGLPQQQQRRHRSNFDSNRPVFADPAARSRRQAIVLSLGGDKTNGESVRHPPSDATEATTVRSKRVSWPKIALLTVSTALGTTFGISPTASRAALNKSPVPVPQTTTNTSNANTGDSSTQPNASSAENDMWSPIAVKSSKSRSSLSSSSSKPLILLSKSTSKPNSSSSTTSSSSSFARKTATTNHRGAKRSSYRVASNAISLDELGIKRDDFLSDRELRRRKTTVFSEAEQELMELDEWEVDTQWFRNMQTMWAAIFSIGGIFVLYKGAVMWEKWIKEQEQKDMEEEIKLTGKFVDPRAVRKDEDDDPNKKKKKGDSTPKKPSGSGDQPTAGPTTDDQGGGDLQGGDIESLEKLFGKS